MYLIQDFYTYDVFTIGFPIYYLCLRKSNSNASSLGHIRTLLETTKFFIMQKQIQLNMYVIKSQFSTKKIAQIDTAIINIQSIYNNFI